MERKKEKRKNQSFPFFPQFGIDGGLVEPKIQRYFPSTTIEIVLAIEGERERESKKENKESNKAMKKKIEQKLRINTGNKVSFAKEKG